MDDWELKFAAPCITHFEKSQTAQNMSLFLLDILEEFGICQSSVNCSLFHNAEAATGRILSEKTGAAGQACMIHSFSRAIKRSTGLEKYKGSNEKKKQNNPECVKLVKATSDQVQVFEKS